MCKLEIWDIDLASLGVVIFEAFSIHNIRRHKGNVETRNITYVWLNKNCEDSLKSF